MRKWTAFGLISMLCVSLWWLLREPGTSRDATQPGTTNESALTTTHVDGGPGAAASPTSGNADVVAESTRTEAVNIPPPVVKPAAVIRGRAVDGQTGAPLAGCRVRLHGWPGNRHVVEDYRREHGEVVWEDPPEQTSLEDGRFEFAFVPPPPFQFTLEIDCDGFAAAYQRWMSIEPGRILEVGDVTLEGGTEVRGRAIERNGVPVVGAQVSMDRGTANILATIGGAPRERTTNRPPRPAITDSDGEFVLPTPAAAGSWDLRVRGRFVETPKQLVIEPQQEHASVEIVVTPQSEVLSLSGVVVDDDGEPVRGAEVRARLPGHHGFGPYVSTNTSGEFTFTRGPNFPREALTLRATCVGYEPSDSDNLVPWGTSGNRLVIRRGVSFTVRVTDEATGLPIENFGVRIEPDVSERLSISGETIRPQDRGVHDAGIYTTKPMRRAKYRFWVVAEDSSLRQGGPIVVQLGDTEIPRQEVQLRRATERTLRLVDASGAPVTGVFIELLEPQDGPEITFHTAAVPDDGRLITSSADRANLLVAAPTDESGQAQLMAHGRFACALRIFGRGCLPVIHHDITLDDLPDPWILEVSRGATITGRVGPTELLDRLRHEVGLDRGDQEPEAHRRSPSVTLVRDPPVRTPGFPGKVALERDGTFHLTGVPAGDWQLLFTMRRSNVASERQHLTKILDLRAEELREFDLHLDEAALGQGR